MNGPVNSPDLSDDTLEAWITAAAFEYDVPEDGAARVLSAAGKAPASRDGGTSLPAGVRRLPLPAVPRPRLVAAAVLLVGAVAGASVWGATGPAQKSAGPRTIAEAKVTRAADAVQGKGQLDTRPEKSVHGFANDSSTVAGGAVTPAAPAPIGPTALSFSASNDEAQYQDLTQAALAPNGSAGAASDSAKIVHTGTLTLTVGKGKVSTTLTALDNLAAQAQGYVSSTKTTESGSLPSGTVALRVPADSYDSVLAKARTLGTVDTQTSSGTDVTAQSADLQAKMTSLKKVRANYLALLAKAKTIGETLSVQQHVDDNQGQIDQLQGQINVLADQAAYGTLTVTVTQKAPPTPVAKSTHHKSGVAVAWDRAVNGFVTGVEALIARSGRAVLVLILLAAGLLVLRAGWRVGRRRLV